MYTMFSHHQNAPPSSSKLLLPLHFLGIPIQKRVVGYPYHDYILTPFSVSHNDTLPSSFALLRLTSVSLHLRLIGIDVPGRRSDVCPGCAGGIKVTILLLLPSLALAAPPSALLCIGNVLGGAALGSALFAVQTRLPSGERRRREMIGRTIYTLRPIVRCYAPDRLEALDGRPEHCRCLV